MNAATSILKINLSALAHNYDILQSKLKPRTQLAGILKANAYGLGYQRIAQTLTAKGCNQFFVATPEEGIALRQINDNARIYILNGYFNGAEDIYKTHALIPVIGTLEGIERVKSYNQDCALHFDTGMNRLGFDSDETAHLIQNKEHLLNGISLDYIMSHFACADDPEHRLNQDQCTRFAKVAAHFPNTPKSLCNSSALFRFEDHIYDLARPGYALYGGNPTPENKNPMRAVATLDARILQIRHAHKNETCGYGAGHHFDRKTPLATLSLGYADGFLRSGSDRVTLYYKNTPCPVIGRISMDLVTVSLENITGKLPEEGEYISVIGPNQTIDTVAHTAGTIGYEILTGLSRRASRLYIQD